jgi:hypothetical protein
MNLADVNLVAGKKALGSTFQKIKNSLHDTFITPSIIGEAMWKNSIVEGVEEVTEQAVLDMTKGVVDVLSSLGLTEKQGSFGGWDVVFSKSGWENYLSNFVGGILGGALFEFQHSQIEPWLNPNMQRNVAKNVYGLLADGQLQSMIKIVNDQKSK